MVGRVVGLNDATYANVIKCVYVCVTQCAFVCHFNQIIKHLTMINTKDQTVKTVIINYDDIEFVV